MNVEASSPARRGTIDITVRFRSIRVSSAFRLPTLIRIIHQRQTTSERVTRTGELGRCERMLLALRQSVHGVQSQDGRNDDEGDAADRLYRLRPHLGSHGRTG